MTLVDPQWLAQVREDALDSQRPIIDAHHHLWDTPHSTYLPADLIADACAHNLCQTVFVECMAGYRTVGPAAMRPLGETAFVTAVAPLPESDATMTAPRLATGIIAFADLQLGAAVAPVLTEHEALGTGRYKGIRHCCTWDASDEVRNSHTDPPQSLYLRDDFREGFAQLAEQGATFEAWCYHTQLGELASLASSFPEVPIVLDHVGGPLGIGPYAGRRTEVFEQWQAGIRQLAGCANVVIKLGGLAMPINGFGWHKHSLPPGSEELAASFAPYFHYCIEQFGVERCMFESNFPVDKISCSYTILWNAFKRIASLYSQAQQDALLHDNAVKVYQLAQS